MVGLSGLEPPTSRLSGVRSNQLSYRPIYMKRVITLSKLNQTTYFHSAQAECSDLVQLRRPATSQLPTPPIDKSTSAPCVAVFPLSHFVKKEVCTLLNGRLRFLSIL